MEFSENDFAEYSKFNELCQKPKSDFNTRNTACVTTDTFLDVVVKFISITSWEYIYLFSKVEDNRRLSGSNGNLLSITIVGNTPIARHIIFLVTIPILDFVMIPISFWEN